MKNALYLFAAPALLVAAPVFAQTTTDTLNVTATVTASCDITSTTMLAFGSVTQSATDVDNAGAVDLICTNSTPWFLSAAAGANAIGAQNRMKHASLTEYLNYDIYSDTSRSDDFSDRRRHSRCRGHWRSGHGRGPDRPGLWPHPCGPDAADAG